MEVIQMFEKEFDNYVERGFCILRGFFNQKEVDELLEHINDYIENEAEKLSGRDINYADGEINSIHALHKGDNYFTRLAAQERILTAAKVFLNAEPELRGAELFAKPAKVGMPSPMHQDNFYWCVDGANALTMWVAMDFCNEENGGIAYYEGSHKLGIVNHVDSYAPGSSQKIQEEILMESDNKMKKVVPSVEPGDVLVHHSLTFHGSSANKSAKSRRGFTMQFKDKNAKYDKEMLTHYEDHLMRQVANREAAI